MVMSVSDADSLLSTGRISPATHASIVAANGGAKMPGFGPPMAPPPMLPQGGPLDDAIAASNGGQAPPMAPAPPPPEAPGPMLRGVDAFLPAMQQAAATLGPDASPRLPPGHVDVGHIQQVSAPAPAPHATTATGAPSGPRGASGATDMLRAENAGLEGMKGTQGKLNDLGAQSAVEQESLRANQQADADQARVLAMAARKEEDDHKLQLMTDRGNAVQEYRTAKVDPTQVAKQRGVLGNILAAIAMGAGAFGSAITHAPNFAQQILDKQVDDNIRAQEGEIAKLGHSVDMKTNSIAAYRQITGDNDAARALARADLIGQHRDELAANMAKYGNAEQQAKGAQVIANYTTEQDKNNAQAKMAMERAYTAQAAAAAAKKSALDAQVANTAKDFALKGQDPVEAMRNAVALHTGRVVGTAPLQALATPEKTATQDKLAERIVKVDGQYHEAATADDAKQIKEAATLRDNILRDTAIVKSLREKFGSEVMDREAIAKANAAASRLTISVATLGKLGALSGSDRQLTETQIPSEPLAFMATDGSVLERANELADAANSNYQSILNSRLKGAAPAVTREAKGAEVGFKAGL